MYGLLILFSDAKVDQLIPYFAPIDDRESPLLTVYVDDEEVDVLLVEPILIVSPTVITLVLLMLFADARALTVVPYSAAIADNVSPLLTVYVDEDVDELVEVDELVDEEAVPLTFRT